MRVAAVVCGWLVVAVPALASLDGAENCQLRCAHYVGLGPDMVMFRRGCYHGCLLAAASTVTGDSPSEKECRFECRAISSPMDKYSAFSPGFSISSKICVLGCKSVRLDSNEIARAWTAKKEVGSSRPFRINAGVQHEDVLPYAKLFPIGQLQTIVEVADPQDATSRMGQQAFQAVRHLALSLVKAAEVDDTDDHAHSDSNIAELELVHLQISYEEDGPSPLHLLHVLVLMTLIVSMAWLLAEAESWLHFYSKSTTVTTDVHLDYVAARMSRKVLTV